MTHWRWPSEKPRSACAAGSAMFTTVASSTTISWARATVARVHHLREWADDGRWGVDRSGSHARHSIRDSAVSDMNSS